MMNFDVVKRIVAYGRELEKTHNKKFRFTITTNCYDVPADAPDSVSYTHLSGRLFILSIRCAEAC